LVEYIIIEFKKVYLILKSCIQFRIHQTYTGCPMKHDSWWIFKMSSP